MRHRIQFYRNFFVIFNFKVLPFKFTCNMMLIERWSRWTVLYFLLWNFISCLCNIDGISIEMMNISWIDEEKITQRISSLSICCHKFIFLHNSMMDSRTLCYVNLCFLHFSYIKRLLLRYSTTTKNKIESHPRTYIIYLEEDYILLHSKFSLLVEKKSFEKINCVVLYIFYNVKLF